MPEYVLGTNDAELARLSLQQEVWGIHTDRFLDRLSIRPGWRCLDLGCGPGFVLESLRKRVGESGSVVALDESPIWMAHLRKLVAERGWRNVSLLESKIESAPLEPGSFDLIFARWVLSFPPRVDEIVRRLASWLKPGGILAVQDYNHEGISLFPESAGFRAAVEGTRKLYRSGGGDPWIAGRLPGLCRAAGLEVVSVTPYGICGGPSSPAWRWADAFFPPFTEKMVLGGHIREEERQLFLREWAQRAANPDSMFFSPYLVDLATRRMPAK